MVEISLFHYLWLNACSKQLISTAYYVTINLCCAKQLTFEKGNIMRFNTETKTYKLFSALQSGASITASQASKRFGIKNISAEVSRIRQAGFAVYANSRKAGNGVKVTEYVIGKPSRKIVAAGYKAMALGLV
jgi:hypothetical protein